MSSFKSLSDEVCGEVFKDRNGMLKFVTLLMDIQASLDTEYKALSDAYVKMQDDKVRVNALGNRGAEHMLSELTRQLNHITKGK